MLFVTAVALCVATIFFYHWRTGVPPVPSSASERQDVCALLGALPKGAMIYELGCGWGGLVRALAQRFPETRIVGVELSPLPLLIARVFAPKNARIVRGDFLRMDLREADAVVCYLMFAPMKPLAEKFARELRPGTRVVSLAFWMREQKPVETRGNAALYVFNASSAR
jgi:trans-aconitate methyltransferase